MKKLDEILTINYSEKDKYFLTYDEWKQQIIQWAVSKAPEKMDSGSSVPCDWYEDGHNKSTEQYKANLQEGE